MGGTSYRDLVAWQKAMMLVRQVYHVTASWPSREMYGLASQIQRAAVSVPSNIAEGQGRGSAKDFQHHLHIAYGSLMELETQTMIAQDLAYIKKDQASDILLRAAEVGKLINGLCNALSH